MTQGEGKKCRHAIGQDAVRVDRIEKWWTWGRMMNESVRIIDKNSPRFAGGTPTSRWATCSGWKRIRQKEGRNHDSLLKCP